MNQEFKIVTPSDVKQHIRQTFVETVNTKMLCPHTINKPPRSVPISKHELFAVEETITMIENSGWEVKYMEKSTCTHRHDTRCGRKMHTLGEWCCGHKTNRSCCQQYMLNISFMDIQQMDLV
jgi:hypothetical protein